MAARQVIDRSLDGLFSSISCTVLSACQERLPRHGRVAREAAAHYRLYVCLRGAAQVVVHGQEEAQDLASGGVVLVPPGAAHEVWTASTTPLAVYTIDFIARLHGIIDVPAFCGLPVALLPSAIRRPKIIASAQSIVNHLTNHIPGYQLAVHTHCVRLLDLLWKETLAGRSARPVPPPGAASRPTGSRDAGYASDAGAVRSTDLFRLGPAFRLVEERFAQHITLAELAATAHLHPVYFSTVFKRATGLPPLHYLSRYRLERVRDLLLVTDRPVEEIARLTGYCDAAHLIRVFRRQEGVSPGRYRRLAAA